MSETDLFVNEGFGWECRLCRDSGRRVDSADDPTAAAAGSRTAPEGDDSRAPADGADALPRFFREGEAEERETRLASRALARWRDTPRGRALHCPRCGAEEVPRDEG